METKLRKATPVLDGEKVTHRVAPRGATKYNRSRTARFSDLAALAAACVTAAANNAFISRIAAGVFIAVIMLQFAAARRMAANSGKTQEETRKVLAALAVVRTFVLVLACGVLTVSLVVPFSLRIVGALAAFSTLRSVLAKFRQR
jgi:hypothetical protein